jgi:hypothetical protein
MVVKILILIVLRFEAYGCRASLYFDDSLCATTSKICENFIYDSILSSKYKFHISHEVYSDIY